LHSQVLGAPEAKQNKARDEHCQPYKTVRWEEFLEAVLGPKVAGPPSLCSPLPPIHTTQSTCQTTNT